MELPQSTLNSLWGTCQRYAIRLGHSIWILTFMECMELIKSITTDKCGQSAWRSNVFGRMFQQYPFWIHGMIISKKIHERVINLQAIPALLLITKRLDHSPYFIWFKGPRTRSRAGILVIHKRNDRQNIALEYQSTGDGDIDDDDDDDDISRSKLDEEQTFLHSWIASEHLILFLYYIDCNIVAVHLTLLLRLRQKTTT